MTVPKVPRHIIHDCQGDSAYWRPENWNITRGATESNIPVKGLPIFTIIMAAMCYMCYFIKKSARPTELSSNTVKT